MRDRQKLRLVLLLALALAALLLIVLGPTFLGRFSLNVLTRSMIYAMLAITVDLLWGYTGVLTFGQAAFFGVGAYATAMLVAFLLDPDAPVTRQGTIGDHRKIPSAIFIRAFLRWRKFRHMWYRLFSQRRPKGKKAM